MKWWLIDWGTFFAAALVAYPEPKISLRYFGGIFLISIHGIAMREMGKAGVLS